MTIQKIFHITLCLLITPMIQSSAHQQPSGNLSPEQLRELAQAFGGNVKRLHKNPSSRAKQPASPSEDQKPTSPATPPPVDSKLPVAGITSEPTESHWHIVQPGEAPHEEADQNPQETLGVPYPPAKLGPQNKPQPASVWGSYDKSATLLGGTCSSYCEAILAAECAIDAFTRKKDGVRNESGTYNNPNHHLRVIGALGEDIAALDTAIAEIIQSNREFSTQQEQEITDFLQQQAQSYERFARKQRKKFFESMTRADKLITMIATIQGAKGVLSESCIETQRQSLLNMFAKLDAVRLAHDQHATKIMETMTRATSGQLRQQAEEIYLKHSKIDHMIKALEQLHPQPARLSAKPPLKPF